MLFTAPLNNKEIRDIVKLMIFQNKEMRIRLEEVQRKKFKMLDRK